MMHWVWSFVSRVVALEDFDSSFLFAVTLKMYFLLATAQKKVPKKSPSAFVRLGGLRRTGRL